MTKEPDTIDDLPLFALSHRNDPETSREAVESIADKLTAIQDAVLAALERAGRDGLADFQLAALFPSASYSTYRTRRGELAAKGLVVDSGRRITRDGSNRRHVVWVLSKFQENADETRP